MDYRTLGSTGLRVSVIGIGTTVLDAASASVDDNESIAAIQVALESAINFIEIGPSIAAPLAEEIIGKALQGRREGVVVASVCSLGRLALNRLLQQPGMTAAVPPASRPTQIREWVGATEWLLSADENGRIDKILAAHAKKLDQPAP